MFTYNFFWFTRSTKFCCCWCWSYCLFRVLRSLLSRSIDDRTYVKVREVQRKRLREREMGQKIRSMNEYNYATQILIQNRFHANEMHLSYSLFPPPTSSDCINPIKKWECKITVPNATETHNIQMYAHIAHIACFCFYRTHRINCCRYNDSFH